jgi:hypothetical protein
MCATVAHISIESVAMASARRQPRQPLGAVGSEYLARLLQWLLLDDSHGNLILSARNGLLLLSCNGFCSTTATATTLFRPRLSGGSQLQWLLLDDSHGNLLHSTDIPSSFEKLQWLLLDDSHGNGATNDCTLDTPTGVAMASARRQPRQPLSSCGYRLSPPHAYAVRNSIRMPKRGGVAKWLSDDKASYRQILSDHLLQRSKRDTGREISFCICKN